MAEKQKNILHFFKKRESGQSLNNNDATKLSNENLSADSSGECASTTTSSLDIPKPSCSISTSSTSCDADGTMLFQNVGNSPHHPTRNYEFKKTKIGEQYRSCKIEWFDKFPWLHYDEVHDKLFCFYCIKCAEQNKSLSSCRRKGNFIYKGFSNWKKANDKFRKHENSIAHKDAFFMVEKLLKTTPDVAEMMSSQLAKEKAKNRK